MRVFRHRFIFSPTLRAQLSAPRSGFVIRKASPSCAFHATHTARYRHRDPHPRVQHAPRQPSTHLPSPETLHTIVQHSITGISIVIHIVHRARPRILLRLRFLPFERFCACVCVRPCAHTAQGALLRALQQATRATTAHAVCSRARRCVPKGTHTRGTRVVLSPRPCRPRGPPVLIQTPIRAKPSPQLQKYPHLLTGLLRPPHPCWVQPFG